ncbi:ArsR family transcriptional regulator [Candidatus Woesearchaeota archaeon]|nr:ArsR family transcriptional regulator [Candidatus Woesearchaeota archaeon]
MSLLDFVSFVKRGRNRQTVFHALDKPSMPSELTRKIYGKTSNTFFNIISRALTELTEKKLVEVVNPKEKTGRIYRKTTLGKHVEKNIRLLK